jgi:hypothetical protein
MPVATQAEYVSVDGVPLSTPAWHTESLAELYDIAMPEGDLVTVPYLRGALAARRQLGPKRVRLPVVIYGDADSDGNPHSDVREGLLANRDEFVRDVVRPLQVGSDGLRTMVHTLPGGGTRSGPCQVVGSMRPVPVGRSALRVAVEFALTEGGLRDTTQVDVSGSGSLAVPNTGNDYQDAIIYTLTGTATSVKVENTTADPGGDIWFEFGGDLTGGVVLDTRLYTAVRGGVNVVGLVQHSGHERWCPLIPGTNTLTITPTGGTCTLQAQHYPFFA